VPVDLHYATRVTNEITYHLPDGFTVEGVPQDQNIPWPSHALFVAKSATQPGQITIGDTLTIAFALLKSDDYQALRGFYQKVATTGQETLILSISPAAKAAPVGLVK